MKTNIQRKFFIILLALSLPFISDSFASKKVLDQQQSSKRSYQLTEKGRKKYNGEEAIKYIFTPEGFKNIKTAYGKVKVPEFMVDLLQLKNCYHRKALKENGKLFEWSKDGKFVIMPNPSYVPLDDIKSDPKKIKDNAEGLGLIIWAIHPDLLKNSIFHCPNRNVINSRLVEKIAKQNEERDESSECAEDDSPKFSLDLLNTKFSAFHREEEPYLSSILDLNPGHISMLEEMETKAMDHLRSVYGVTDEDQVRLYFHFPYASSTVTLHLHIRVNQFLHPLEESKSFPLNEIIEALRDGLSIEHLILKKQHESGEGIYANSGAEDTMEGIEGVKVEKIENPFIFKFDDLN